MATAMRAALVDRIAGMALAHRVAGKLTGDYDDLRRLLAEMNARPPVGHYGLMSFLRAIERGIDTQSGLAALFTRIGRELNPRAKRKLPLWEAQIADPSDRWHREKPEYENLSRFRQKPPEA